MIDDVDVRENGRSAAAVVTNADGEVLLQLRDDIPGIIHPGRWGLPGGAFEAGEDAPAALRREVREETGITVGRARPLLDVVDEVRDGGDGRLIHVFHVEYTGPAAGIVCGEGQEMRFFPLRDVPADLPRHVREAVDAYAKSRTRVVLRPVTAGDREEFLALANASVGLHHPWISLPTTPDAFDSYLGRFADPAAEGFLVCAADTGAIAGVINVRNIVREGFQSGTLGYAAFAPSAGLGYLSEGLSLVLRHAFGPLGLHRLEANVQPGNLASLRLVERLGFRKEGYSPGFLFVDGAWRDHERWALTADVVDVTP